MGMIQPCVRGMVWPRGNGLNWCDLKNVARQNILYRNSDRVAKGSRRFVCGKRVVGSKYPVAKKTAGRER